MERDFKGVWIPKEIWLDERLNALEKVICAEIDSLDMGNKGCYASNKHLAEFCHCSERKVSEAISKLTEYCYIYVSTFDGRQRILKSNLPSVRGRLAESARQTSRNCEADTQNLLQSNTDSNTDSNNKYIYSAEPRKSERKNEHIPPTLEEVKEYCESRGNHIDAEAFMDYYEARGWKLNNNRKVSSWKACIRTWERNNYGRTENKSSGSNNSARETDESFTEGLSRGFLGLDPAPWEMD